MQLVQLSTLKAMFHNGARVSERLDSIEATQAHILAITTAISNALKHRDLNSSLCGATPDCKTTPAISEESNFKVSGCAAIPAEVNSDASIKTRWQSMYKQGILRHAQLSFNSEEGSLFSSLKECNRDSDLKEPQAVSSDTTMNSMKLSSVHVCKNSGKQQKFGVDKLLQKDEESGQRTDMEWASVAVQEQHAKAVVIESACSLQATSSRISGICLDLIENDSAVGSSNLKHPIQRCEDTHSIEDEKEKNMPVTFKFYTQGTCKQPAHETKEPKIDSRIALHTQAGLSANERATKQSIVPLSSQPALESDRIPVELMQQHAQQHHANYGLPQEQGSTTSKHLMFC
jgi:hypothetical protein